MKDMLLKEYAKLIVRIGANVQKDQIVILNAPVEAYAFTKLVIEEAYLAGAKKVVVNWSYGEDNKLYYQYASEETLKEFPEYNVKRLEYFMDNKAAQISVGSPNPDLMKGIDPKKFVIASKAANEKIGFYRKYMMSNGSQWTIGIVPNLEWGKKVFPDVPYYEVIEKLWGVILEACRVREGEDVVENWKKHHAQLAEHREKLNKYNFKSLHFKNKAGTDLVVNLVEGHIWGGGSEVGQNGVTFSPNIPTEEIFTMPHSHGVNGKVVATMPLSYQGVLIEDFWFEFKDGKVVDYGAKVGKEVLKTLVELDEGSSRLGEVALISHNSPISNMGILFYNTLFDENASCHLALGNAYTMNIKAGYTLSEEELMKKGYNKSMAHVDFMFGSSDMEIVGTTQDGKKVKVFTKGNFAF